MARRRRQGGADGGGPSPARRRPGPPMGTTVLVVVASLVSALALYFLLFRVPSVATAVSAATAKVTGLVLTLFGAGVSANGPNLEGNGVRFAVVPDCTPLAPFMLLTGAMLAFPTSIRAKARGILLGAAVLSVLNLVRIVTLVYIGMYAPNALEVAHLLVWQSVMILAGILVWLFWLNTRVRGAQT